MKRLLLSSLLASSFCFSALADQSIPQKGGGGRGRGHVDWKGQCAERLESALQEARRTLPWMATAQIEVRSQEVAQPGDPTAKTAVDVVEVRKQYSAADLESLRRRNGDEWFRAVDTGAPPLFLARVEPYTGQPLLNPLGWVRIAGFPRLEKRNYEPRTERYGTILINGGGGDSRILEKLFTPAVEDCLKMKK